MKKLTTLLCLFFALNVSAQTKTHFGVLSAFRDSLDQLTAAQNLETQYVRDIVILANWNEIRSRHVDFWITRGYTVLLTISNDVVPSPFPTDTVAYESELRSVLDVYSPEVVVIENEELNAETAQSSATTPLYHTGPLQDYINELSVAVRVCKEKGLQVTNGGLTTPVIASLQNYYKTNNKLDSALWLNQQMNGIDADTVKRIRSDSLLQAYKVLDLSFINLHWYEPLKGMTRMTGVLPVIINFIKQQTGKNVITNETGVKTGDSSFVTALMKQWDSANVKYAVFYDSEGIGSVGAYPLTTVTGALLHNGIAYKNLNQSNLIAQTKTNFGVLAANRVVTLQITAAQNLGTNYVRDIIMLTGWNGLESNHVDTYIANGYTILLNINNDVVPSSFPTDMDVYESKLRSVLDKYNPEVVVIENEELNAKTAYSSTTNPIYHTGPLQDYINELAVAVRVCKEKGLQVTNGGLTTPVIASLQNYYVINNKLDSALWLNQSMGGVFPDTVRRMRSDSLLQAYKNLDLSFVNLHWYEPLKGMTRMTGVLPVLINFIKQQTGKNVITNETGVKTGDSSYVTALMKQWDSAGVKYAIFFDNEVVGLGGAYPLTTETGALVDNGTAFRNYTQGVIDPLVADTTITLKTSKTENKSSFVKVYPNPVKNVLHVEGLNASANTTLSILNFSGTEIYKAAISGNSYNLNAGHLTAGIYYLKIQSGQSVITKTFIKE